METPKQLYLVTEYACGGELFDYIVSHKRLKENKACHLFHQLLSGIEYLHKLNIVHRDLKPENLLLDESENIKIVDFGLSNIYRQGEKLKTACGSPCYAAPEMIAGKKYIGLQVDIWSAGVVLFAMLAGYLPFEDKHTSNLYKKIMSGTYKMPKYLSINAQDLIQHLLCTDPTRRYTMDDIRSHPWFNLAPNADTQGIIVGQQKISVVPDIILGLGQYGFNPDYVSRCIENNKHNHVTTAYYLQLLKKCRGNLNKDNNNKKDFNKTQINFSNQFNKEKNIKIEEAPYFPSNWKKELKIPFSDFQKVKPSSQTPHAPFERQQ